jgi:hypothetical protein
MPQATGDQTLKSLKLTKNYMVTVVYSGPGDPPSRAERYYLPRSTVLKEYLRLGSSTVEFARPVDLQVDLKTQPVPSKRVLEIRSQAAMLLIHVPALATCWPDDSDPHVFKCELQENETMHIPLPPGEYEFSVSGCKAMPDHMSSVKQVKKLEIECN